LVKVSQFSPVGFPTPSCRTTQKLDSTAITHPMNVKHASRVETTEKDFR